MRFERICSKPVLYWKIRNLERVGSGNNAAEFANQTSVIGSAQPFWGRLILSAFSLPIDHETSVNAAESSGEGKFNGYQTAEYIDAASRA
jgi:hypothetical protein